MPEDFSQSNIDKLLEDALAGPTSPFPEEPTPGQENSAAGEGPDAQDDIDSLLSGVPAETAEAPAEGQEEPPGEAVGVDLAGATEAGPDADAEPPAGDTAPQGQKEIDTPLAEAEEPPPPEAEPADSQADEEAVAVEEVEEAGEAEEAEAPPEPAAAGESAEQEEEVAESPPPEGGAEEAAPEPAPEAAEPTKTEEEPAASPLPQEEEPEPPAPAPDEASGLDDILKETTAAGEAEPEFDALAQEPPAPPPAEERGESATASPTLAEQKIPEVDLDSIRQSLSLMESGSELESMTGEIASLLGQLSERARRYQNAYQTGNHELNDIKARLRSEERRNTLLKSEKTMLQEEMLELRSRLDSLENDHLARMENAKKEIASLESRLRERDAIIRRLEGQVESINKELDEAHIAITDMEVAVRKANFEEERMRNEFDSERQERARLQRALETREAEIQAIQERASGEASTIFIDELHRLVRRYENEVNVRTGAARDALSALEKLEATPATQQVYNIVRESLLIAAATDSAAGALEQLSQDSSAPAASRHELGQGAPGKTVVTINDFVQNLQTLNLEDACLDASRLLLDKQASPAVLAGQLYVNPSLREARVTGHLMGVITLMRQLLSAQKALDKARGRETQETERFYVQIFDLLHHLVRIKAITRATPEAWRFFLDIRGRYSFITSDAQWISYRDKQMRLH